MTSKKRRQKLNSNSIGYLRARLLHKAGRKVIWLEDFEGELYLSVDRGGYAFVYHFYKIGRLGLQSNYHINGRSVSYIKYWAPYKPGKPYRRKAKSLPTTSSGTTISFSSNFLQNIINSPLNQSSGQVPSIPAPPPTTAQRNAQLMQKKHSK